MTALEDSTLKLEALKPYVKTQKEIIKLQTEKHAAEQKEWMHKETVLIVQRDDCQTALTNQIEAGRGKSLKSGLIGFAIGTILVSIVKAVGN